MNNSNRHNSRPGAPETVGTFDELAWCLQTGRVAQHKDGRVCKTTAPATATAGPCYSYILGVTLLATHTLGTLWVTGLHGSTHRNKEHTLNLLHQFDCAAWYQKLLSVGTSTSLPIPVAEVSVK